MSRGDWSDKDKAAYIGVSLKYFWNLRSKDKPKPQKPPEDTRALKIDFRDEIFVTVPRKT